LRPFVDGRSILKILKAILRIDQACSLELAAAVQATVVCSSKTAATATAEATGPKRTSLVSIISGLTL